VQLTENPPSSSKNVNFANGQTNRILVPYALRLDSITCLEVNRLTINFKENNRLID
jgi:hypothetical protein